MGPSFVAKNDDSDEEDGNSSTSSDSRKMDSKKIKTKKMNLVPQPSRTKVTLSGLLNTLDGPGSREGHIVILTKYAPDSLDEALYRPGHVDTQVYPGFADEITAAITFSRIFGSDKEVKVPQKELNRMGRRFGRMVPSDFFTPVEIQKFCMNRRGQPQKALKEFRQCIDEKRAGKTKFQYDIHRRAPKPTFHEKEDVHNDDSSDDSSDDVEYTPSSTEVSSEGAENTPPESSRTSSTKPSATGRNDDVQERLFVAHGDDMHEDDALAYGDYGPRSQGVWEDSLADSVADACQGLKDMITFPSIEPPRHRNAPFGEYSMQNLVVPALSMGKGQHMSLSGIYSATDSSEPRILCKPGIRPRRLSREHYLRTDWIEEANMPNFDPRTTARPSLPRSHPDTMLLDGSRAASPSPTEATDASVYYTPLSVGEQIETRFQRHRRPSHPDVVGRRNLYPYHGPLSDVTEENVWEDGDSPKPATVLLHHVDPQPLEGFEQLGLRDRDHDAAD